MKYARTRDEVLNALALIVQGVTRDASREDKRLAWHAADGLGSALSVWSDEERPVSVYSVTDLLDELTKKLIER